MQKELDKIEKNATMVVEQNMPKDAADALLKDVRVSGTFRAATYNQLKLAYTDLCFTLVFDGGLFSPLIYCGSLCTHVLLAFRGYPTCLPSFKCYYQTCADSYSLLVIILLQEFVAQYREQFHTLVTKGQEIDETYGKLLVIAIM